MSILQYEVSREPPCEMPARFFSRGMPILYAFGCALLERQTETCFVYTAVNLETGKCEVLGRRVSPISPNEAGKMAERIRRSAVAGAGRFEADRMYGRQIDLDKCREIVRMVFRGILPKHGYVIRKEQMALSGNMLDSVYRRAVTLAEAEVGTGKTLAYLVAAIVAKRGRLNDFWNKAFYPEMSYADMAQMPIVIATSSIALQKAILKEYIPELSEILLDSGIIKTPVSAVLRKGREHYVCDQNLRSCLSYETCRDTKQALIQLLTPKAPIDIAEIDGLDRYNKRKIAVPDKCVFSCPHRDKCAYLRFRKYANSPAIDIQVVNHNYFLADMRFRAAGKRPLIPNYQTVIIDEAHKFLSAARTMYGSELSSFSIPEVMDAISNMNFMRESAQKIARIKAKKLYNENRRLFKGLDILCRDGETDDEAARLTAVIDSDGARHLRNLRNIAAELSGLLVSEPVKDGSEGKKSDAVWELAAVNEQLAALSRHKDKICWLEKPDSNVTAGTGQEIRLCAIPKDIDATLYKNLWSRGIPTILTSGTLSAGGDFSHIRKTLGLEALGSRLSETTKPSPFNHIENALLYISGSMPFPDQASREYIAAVVGETERLILASHGHAAVLFTSYKAMDMVWERLKNRRLPFPMYRLDKGGVQEIQKFKHSNGGVLFASGALWEGIDIPGDALSMLIIVKLPFQVPDPISEYEQTLYRDMAEYKRRVIVPEMLIKLRQGFGRLIRTETDTGVVAILDCRANSSGAYHERVLAALPDCRVTADIDDVTRFMYMKKPPEYFRGSSLCEYSRIED